MKNARLQSLVLVGLVAVIAWTFRPAGAHDHNAPIKPTQFNGVIPILNVKSVEKAIEHYTTVLGWDKHWDWPSDNADKTFASITNGKVELFLCEGGQGSPGTWIYYGVDKIDDLHKELAAKGANIKSAPKDEPWGMREMIVRDLDGHTLRIGQGIEQATTQPAEKK